MKPVQTFMINCYIHAYNLQSKQEKISDLNVSKKGFHHACGILIDARNMSVFQIILVALKSDRNFVLMCLAHYMIELYVCNKAYVLRQLLYQLWQTIMVEFRD